MAGVVHHEQLVGLGGDRLEQVRHFVVGDGAAGASVIGQEGFDTPPGGGVIEACAVARIVNEDAVAVLHFLSQFANGIADVVAGGLIVLQVLDVARWHLHRRGHLGRGLTVNSGAWQRRRGGIGVATDPDDQRMTVHAWLQAAHAQRERRVAAGLPATGHARHGRSTRLQVQCAGAHPARDARRWRSGLDQRPAALDTDDAQGCTRTEARHHGSRRQFVGPKFGGAHQCGLLRLRAKTCHQDSQQGQRFEFHDDLSWSSFIA